MKVIRSHIVPIPMKDIDTDMLIPAEFLKSTGKTGLGRHLFKRFRNADPDFPLNRQKYDSAAIMVARDNFGCGSSREHAAWALSDWGIEAVIAPSFADIFHKNALNNRILPLSLSEEIVERIIEAERKNSPYEIRIDLENQTVELPDIGIHEFEIDAFYKELLMTGTDDLGFLMNNVVVIKEFKQEREAKLFLEIDSI